MATDLLLTLAIPAGVAFAIFWAATLALQGRRFWGSWLMLGGALATSLLFLTLIGLCYWSESLWQRAFGPGGGFPYGSPRWQETERLLYHIEKALDGALFVASGSLVLAAIGFLTITLNWIRVQRQCLLLELEVKRLTIERDHSLLKE